MKHLKTILPALALLGIGATAASAHITLETQQAAIGSTYKAVVRVPHGCGTDAKANRPSRSKYRFPKVLSR